MIKNLFIFDIFNISTERLIENFDNFYDNVLILSNDICFLEKKNNFKIFPLNENVENFENLKILFDKNFKFIDVLIFTEIPCFTAPFEKINNFGFDKNLFFLFNFLKKFLSFSYDYYDNINIFIVIHKNFNNKISFWSMTEYTNKSLIFLMDTLNFEYKNFNNLKINCLSTENIKILYKNNIYPYKNLFSTKNIENLSEVIFYIKNKKINNKIVKI